MTVTKTNDSSGEITPATPATESARGRFAPSPSGRMHLGNVYAALMSWLSVRAKNGEWILRIEDLDPQRSKREYAEWIEDDLDWLGLHWDEGGLASKGDRGPYVQSQRHHLYREALEKFNNAGLLYHCTCRRADILASQAPHQSDGRIIYRGSCRPGDTLPFPPIDLDASVAVRMAMPDLDVGFEDGIFGHRSVNLAKECGDIILRRADGAWAYQLAVVVDDALMGITEVVRGCDLLLSAGQQVYLHRLTGYNPPEFIHLPLLCNEAGQRLSKRDKSLAMDVLRERHKPEEIIGRVAHVAGLIPEYSPCRPDDLIGHIPKKLSLHPDTPMERIEVVCP